MLKDLICDFLTVWSVMLSKYQVFYFNMKFDQVGIATIYGMDSSVGRG